MMTRIQGMLYDRLCEVYGDDVLVSDLHDTVWPADKKRGSREMQTRVGAHVSRINRLIAYRGQKIVPGDLKRSYRMSLITALAS